MPDVKFKSLPKFPNTFDDTAKLYKCLHFFHNLADTTRSRSTPLDDHVLESSGLEPRSGDLEDDDDDDESDR